MNPASGQPREILVIQLARFGDFLQTTPLLAALKAADPTARLAVLVSSGLSKLAGANPQVDEVLSLDLEALARVAQSPRLGLSRKLDHLGARLAGLRARSFDRVINLNTSRIAALLGHLVRTKKREGPQFGPDRRRLLTAPWASFIMNLLARRRLIRFNLVDLLTGYAGVKARVADRLTYPLGPEAAAEGRALLAGAAGRPLVGLQLGSKHWTRQWPLEGFARLAGRLIEEDGAGIVLVGTAAEQGLGREFLGHLERLAPRARDRVSNLMGRTSIEALAGVLAGLDLLVSTDTGTMHLAAALDRPLLALFVGPAFCHETGPYGPGHLILQALTECSPCTENEAACAEAKCRDLIRPEAVLAAARRLLDPAGAPLPGPSELGPQVRLLVSELDDFGTVYRPAGPWALDREESLALAYREAGRAFMRPGYRTGRAGLAAELARYGPPAGEETADLAAALDRLARELPVRTNGPQARARLEKAAAGCPELGPLVRVLLLPGVAGEQGLGRRMVAEMSRVLGLVRAKASPGPVQAGVIEDGAWAGQKK